MHKLDPSLENRLYNFKFYDAQRKLTDDTDPEVKVLVNALAECFGNPGGFSGHISTIVVFALSGIGVKFD